jgi:hypothetical protein
MSLNTLESGTYALASTDPEQIDALPAGASGGIIIKALSGNTDDVFVGGSSSVTNTGAAATDGFPLAPGESVPIDLYNANDLWFKGTIGDRIAFLSLTA